MVAVVCRGTGVWRWAACAAILARGANGAMAELGVTLLVVVLVFAAMKIPSLGDAIGRLVRGPGRPAQPPTRPEGR